MSITTDLPLPCARCGGEGREWRSRHGGNDPDVWDAGACQQCAGSGDQPCEECGQDPAVLEWKEGGKCFLLCRACWEAYWEDFVS